MRPTVRRFYKSTQSEQPRKLTSMESCQTAAGHFESKSNSFRKRKHTLALHAQPCRPTRGQFDKWIPPPMETNSPNLIPSVPADCPCGSPLLIKDGYTHAICDSYQSFWFPTTIEESDDAIIRQNRVTPFSVHVAASNWKSARLEKRKSAIAQPAASLSLIQNRLAASFKCADKRTQDLMTNPALPISLNWMCTALARHAWPKWKLIATADRATSC